MKKTLYTLNINDFSPEITELTYPFLKKLAHKIRADFYVIDTRKYLDMPPVYEKFQVYDLMKERHDDWAWFLDSDTLVHPDMFDPTDFITKGIIMHHGIDWAAHRWTYDDYFRRDGRNIGSCTWWVLCSNWCRDLWEPLQDMTLQEALDSIHPIPHELATVITPSHLIDDYCLSRNIAKYGLHVKTFFDLMEELKVTGNYFFHIYDVGIEEKVKRIHETMIDWELKPKPPG